jgi:hypothetical protein
MAALQRKERMAGISETLHREPPIPTRSKLSFLPWMEVTEPDLVLNPLWFREASSLWMDKRPIRGLDHLLIIQTHTHNTHTHTHTHTHNVLGNFWY